MADKAAQVAGQVRHLIPTYCEYVNKYIVQAGVHGKGAIPGEHHFVALYLVPRLTEFSFLGVPHYVNPDGMKASAGDVVYYSYAPHESLYYVPTPRLKIEVKLENPIDRSIQLTRTQYYHWIRQEWCPEKKGTLNLSANPEQPDLFVGISNHGVVVLPWATFRSIFSQTVYPKGLIDIVLIKGRPSPTGAIQMSRFDWDKDDTGVNFFRYSKKIEEWLKLEASFVTSLKQLCNDLTSGSPIQPLQSNVDI